MANIVYLPSRPERKHQPPYQDPSALLTVDPAGVAPKKRVDDPDQAQNIVAYLAQANIGRANREVQVKSMFDGNAPFNAWKLRKRGEGWRANFNTLEAKGRKAAAKNPYYDLFSGAPTYVTLELDVADARKRAEWSGIVMEELDFMLKEEPRFDVQMGVLIDDYIAYGRAFLFWMDQYGWLPKQIAQTRVLAPDGSTTDLDDWEMLELRQKLRAHQLWDRVGDHRQHKDEHWDKDACVEAIRMAMPEDKQDSYVDPVLVQERLKSCDLYVTARSATIDVAHLLVREFDGKISHLIVLEYGYSNRKPAHPAFLYAYWSRWDKWQNAIAPFFFDHEDGSFHGCSALGKDLFAPCSTKDRQWMQTLNAGFMRSMLLLQARTPSALQKAALQVIGNAMVIPPDVAVQNSQILGDITTSMQINQQLGDMIDQNTGIYRPRVEKPAGNPEPATVSQLRFAQSNVLSSTQVNRFLKQLDPAYAEMYRRVAAPQHGSDPLSEAARDFQERCVRRGVPEEALRYTRFVRASRTVGNGSIAMRQMSLQTLAPFVPQLPVEGQRNWLDDLIAAVGDQSKVERYNPAPDDQMPSDQPRIAALENNAFKTGMPMPVGGTDNNIVHAQSHLAFMTQGVQSLRQGGDMHQVYTTLETAGPHVAQHLKQLAKDPARKGATKALMKQFQQLSMLTDKLGQRMRQQAQTRRKAQAVQQGQDPELQLDAAEMKAKLQMQGQKQSAQLAMKKEAHDQKMRMAGQEHAQKLALADASAAADIQRKRFSAFDPGAV
jgi:hypothetical protein